MTNSKYALAAFESLIYSFVSKAGQVVSSIFIARLVTPSVMGEYGLLLSGYMVVMSFSMNGLIEQTYVRNHSSKEDYSLVLTAGSFLHLLLFCVSNIILYFFSDYTSIGDLRKYYLILSIAILLNVPRIFISSVLQKNLDLRKLRFLQSIGVATSLLFSILLIMLGQPLFGLIISNLIVPIPYIIFGLNNKLYPVLTLSLDKTFLSLISFGLLNTGSSVLSRIRGLYESIQLSAVFGFATTGILTKGLGISSLLCVWMSSNIINNIFPSIASKLTDIKRISDFTEKSLCIILWWASPITLILVLFPFTTIKILLGENWSSVSNYIAKMAVVSVLIFVNAYFSQLLLFVNGPRPRFLVELITFVFLLTAILFFLPLGIDIYLVSLIFINGIIALSFLCYLYFKSWIRLSGLFKVFFPMTMIAILGKFMLTNTAFASLDKSSDYATYIASCLGIFGLTSFMIYIVDPTSIKYALNNFPQIARGGN